MADTRYNKYFVYIKPVITNKYVKSYTPYIFSAIAIIIFIIFAIRPTVLTITGLQKNIEDNQKVLGALEQKALDLSNGKKNLDNMDPSVKNKIITRLPDNAAVTTLINDLQLAVAQNSSISALQIQPATIYTDSTNTNPKQNLGEIQFSFNILGSYPDLLSVLDNLSKTSRLINISSVMLGKLTEGSTTMSVSGKAYYLKE